MPFYLYLFVVYCTARCNFVSKSAIQIKCIIIIASGKHNIRVDCCPGDFGENVLVGRVQTGEPQRRRQAVFITEFCWSHPVELLDFRKVHLGGHQNTGDVAFHVVLLGYRGGKQTVAELATWIIFRGRLRTFGDLITAHK